jgi:hypothetical protein
MRKRKRDRKVECHDILWWWWNKRKEVRSNQSGEQTSTEGAKLSNNVLSVHKDDEAD